MFIVCSNCDFKYLVNSADLKPNGKMVECANCGYQWYQDLDKEETYSSVPSSKNNDLEDVIKNNQNIKKEKNTIKNLPSTIVNQEEPSIRNSLIVIILIFAIFLGIWFSRSYGINTFVLLEFYIREFFFNLNLIISDLAKIIHKTLN
tara:strand:- start:1273 stop:1713 length:441 start_codon:yes stop_codon:yes gene_type:complete